MGQEKAVEVSLLSWLRNIWKAGSPGGRPPGSRGPESTVDYPEISARSPAPLDGVLHLRFGVVTTVGKVREHNEDSYLVPVRDSSAGVKGGAAAGEAGRDSAYADLRPVGPPCLFVVADGMGGQQAGEQASSMAVDHIPRELTNRLDPLGERDDEKATLQAIRDAVALANQEILSLASVETAFANMGTTVVLALFRREQVYITGIGDSRAYRLREGRLEQLTRDHSLADALGDAGTISREEVSTHKFKNVLYNYLGSKDARGGPEEVRVLEFCPGDRFLLATDGLTGVVGDDRLAEVLGTVDEPQGAARMLVDEALENNSKDNITCVVIHVVGD